MRWIPLVNLSLLAGLSLVVLFSSYLHYQTPELRSVNYSKVVKKELPKHPFHQPPFAYSMVGAGPLALQKTTPKLQLPDLRDEVIYYGKNGRPDVLKGQQLYHISLKSGESKAIKKKEKIYLLYQRPENSSESGYHFSPGNEPTSLWFTLYDTDQEEKLRLEVGMKNERGELVESPSSNKRLIVEAKALNTIHHFPWEIGSMRVDTTLLVRQRARWLGSDKFLEMHGGEDFSFTTDRERIDFSLNDSSYSCFVKAGDYLVWSDQRWQNVNEDIPTIGLPLLVVKRIDDKVMSFELWDPEGKGKIPLNLIKTRDMTPLPNLAQDFKFVGAKTWAQFVIEHQNIRFLIKPNDWWIHNENGWQRIETAEEVDDFVNQRLVGSLFILDKMIKQNGRQTLVGHLFNSSRTEVQEVTLLAEQSLSSSSPMMTIHKEEIENPPPQEHFNTLQARCGSSYSNSKSTMDDKNEDAVSLDHKPHPPLDDVSVSEPPGQELTQRKSSLKFSRGLRKKFDDLEVR